jgi:hypothetical protein
MEVVMSGRACGMRKLAAAILGSTVCTGKVDPDISGFWMLSCRGIGNLKSRIIRQKYRKAFDHMGGSITWILMTKTV